MKDKDACEEKMQLDFSGKEIETSRGENLE